MSFPLISRLDFGRSLTLVRFVEALDFVAMIFVFSFLVLELLSVGSNSGPASEVAVIVLPATMLSITDRYDITVAAGFRFSGRLPRSRRLAITLQTIRFRCARELRTIRCSLISRLVCVRVASFAVEHRLSSPA